MSTFPTDEELAKLTKFTKAELIPFVFEYNANGFRSVYLWRRYDKAWLRIDSLGIFKLHAPQVERMRESYKFIGPSSATTEDEIRLREQKAWERARTAFLALIDAHANVTIYNIASAITVPSEYEAEIGG